MKPVNNTDRPFSKKEAREWQELHQYYEQIDSSLYDGSSLYEVQKIATSIGDAQRRHSRLRRRIRRSLAELPENGEEELFFIAFKAIDQVLVQARDRLVAKDLEETHKYISTAEAMMTRAENKLDRLLQH